jgi:hypothetical protein
MVHFEFGSRWIVGLLLALVVMLNPIPALAGSPGAEVGPVAAPDSGNLGLETGPAA